jgi:hypothetical protein
MEPNPFNKTGTLSAHSAKPLAVDLSSDDLPQPRLHPGGGVVMVPLFTDFKLHDICSGPDDANHEIRALRMSQSCDTCFKAATHDSFHRHESDYPGDCCRHGHRFPFLRIRSCFRSPTAPDNARAALVSVYGALLTL